MNYILVGKSSFSLNLLHLVQQGVIGNFGNGGS